MSNRHDKIGCFMPRKKLLVTKRLLENIADELWNSHD
jgi:hypothetical protein